MSFTWITGGVEYSLDVEGYAGLGMAPITRFEERGPLQHGATDDGYRLLPRTITLAFHFEGADWNDLFAQRAQLLSIFKPGEAPGILRWREGGLVRDIEAYLIDGLNFATEDRAGLVQKTAAVLKCPDPTWFDPVAVAISVAAGAAGSGTPVPTDIPMVVGASEIGETIAIPYLGSAPSFPTLIRIGGPVTDPAVENVSTGEILDFTGVSIGAGEYIDLNLRYGYKTAVDQGGANRIADLTPDSDLATFHIAPAPEVGLGINNLRFTGSGTNDLTRFDITFFTRFIGI